MHPPVSTRPQPHHAPAAAAHFEPFVHYAPFVAPSRHMAPPNDGACAASMDGADGMQCGGSCAACDASECAPSPSAAGTTSSAACGALPTPITGRRPTLSQYEPRTAPKTRSTAPRTPFASCSTSAPRPTDWGVGHASYPLPRTNFPSFKDDDQSEAMHEAYFRTAAAAAAGAAVAGTAAAAAATAGETEALLEEWLQRARLRAYSSGGPVADDPWPAHNAHAASSALLNGLQSIMAM